MSGAGITHTGDDDPVVGRSFTSTAHRLRGYVSAELSLQPMRSRKPRPNVKPPLLPEANLDKRDEPDYGDVDSRNSVSRVMLYNDTNFQTFSRCGMRYEEVAQQSDTPNSRLVYFAVLLTSSLYFCIPFLFVHIV